MAFNPAPSDWLGAGYAYATNEVTFPTAAGTNPILTQLTAAEADATTGDIREVIFAFMEAFNAAYLAQASADRPAKMIISKSTSVNGDGSLSNNYSVNITTSIVSQNVAAE